MVGRRADLDLQLVVVAAPNRAHVPVALDALAAGLHVVVDKPLAVTAEDGRRVVDEAERRGLVLSVFHNRRWDGDFLTVRRLVGRGGAGRRLAVRVPVRALAAGAHWPRPGGSGAIRPRAAAC